MVTRLSEHKLHRHCDELAETEVVFRRILNDLGYPPFWTRPQTFATLVQIILEQQVSLASAFAAHQKLVARLGDITPETIGSATDEDLKSCYFSRQKIRYVRALAEEVSMGNLVIELLNQLTDFEVRERLTAITGLGEWSASIYLMEALNRPDFFPLGDVALVNSMKHEFKLEKATSRDFLEQMSSKWSPRRTSACYLLWHAYIERKDLAYPWSS